MSLETYLHENKEKLHNLKEICSSIPLQHILEIGGSTSHFTDIFLSHSTAHVIRFAKTAIDLNDPIRHTLIVGDTKKTLPEFIGMNPTKTVNLIFIHAEDDYETIHSDVINGLKLASSNTIIFMNHAILSIPHQTQQTLYPTKVYVDAMINGYVTHLANALYDVGKGMSLAGYSYSIDPSALTVYQSPFPKIRLGNDYDGGYVVVDIPNSTYSLLLSGGICDDISFEEVFMKRYPRAACIAHDGSVDGLPWKNDSVQFVKKFIGAENTETYTDLHDIIDQHECIFVKMDIEGGEIPWITSLSEDQMNRFEQIAMEFHGPYSSKEVAVFEKLRKTHVLVHLHGNNSNMPRNHKGVIMPNVFECTYLHKKYFTTDPVLNVEPLPSPLDMPNIRQCPEIDLNYPPFVNN